MPVIIVEGADGVGKTTLAKVLAIGGIYIHFPLRSLVDDVSKQLCVCDMVGENCKCEVPNIELGNFVVCPVLKGLGMRDVQNVILANIEDNCDEIVRLHNLGVTVVVDRFVMSNYVYRKIFCSNAGEEFIEKPKYSAAANAVLSLATVYVLSCEFNVIKARLESKSDGDDLDKAAEKLENVRLALHYFSLIDKDNFCIY